MNPAGRSRYRHVLLLARGGMGLVDLVVRSDGRFERLYARKRLYPHYREDAAFRTMFLDEGRVAGLLRHPNVVSVVDVGEDAEGLFLVMDFVDGVPAGKLLSLPAYQDQGLPLQIGLRIAIEAARGLHAAHELRDGQGRPLGLVHRDVSPNNILIGFDGSVRVTDFGIARALGNASATGSGVLKGTAGYFSPEQLRFEQPDRRSDLFSLGVVLYELLVGERLYPNRDDFEGARRTLAEPAPDLGDVRDDAPPALVDLIFQTLAKDPAQRPGSAEEIAERLEGALAPLIEDEGPQGLADFMRLHFADEAERRRDDRTRALTSLREGDAARATSGHLARVLAVAALAVALGGGLWAALSASPGARRASSIGAATVWAGAWHSCALVGADLHCWGKNNEGQLGIGSTVDPWNPVVVPGLQPTAVALGAYHSCACDRRGRALCWGRNEDGQLGSAGGGSLVPREVPGVSGCAQIAAAFNHTCAVEAGGRVLCWGGNRNGQVGPGGEARVPTPTPIAGLGGAAVVALGGHFGGADFSCALQRDGRVLCWGDNGDGQLGDGTSRSRASPAPVLGLGDVSDLAAGGRHACAVTRAGRLLCWGRNIEGALGLERTGVTARATEVPGLERMVRVDAGLAFTCGLAAAGSLWCWGSNDRGQLGDGQVGGTRRPGPVVGVAGFSSFALGEVHACGRHGSGVACWGHNMTGQLGDGTGFDHARPVSVSGLRR
jgi:serine/threonine-protein kinase